MSEWISRFVAAPWYEAAILLASVSPVPNRLAWIPTPPPITCVTAIASPTARPVQRRLDVLREHRREHVDPPEADHDARNRSERLGQRGHRAAEEARRQLAQEERSTERQRCCQCKRDERGHRGAEQEAAGA